MKAGLPVVDASRQAASAMATAYGVAVGTHTRIAALVPGSPAAPHSTELSPPWVWPASMISIISSGSFSEQLGSYLVLLCRRSGIL
jgi:hypothetical protein